MTLPNRPNQHSAYLLRIWRANEEQEWRVFLQDVHTGEQRGFRDFEALVAFFEGTRGRENAAEGGLEIGDRRLATGDLRVARNDTGEDESEAKKRDGEEDLGNE